MNRKACRKNRVGFTRRSSARKTLTAEQLECRRLLAADFGDAPAPFPTLLADDGARHEAVGSLILGSLRDTEADGQGDDGADEDGLTFGAVQIGKLGVTVDFTVSGRSGKIDGWVDFDGDGNWGGPGEQVFDSVDVAEGVNSLRFDVPADVAAGEVAARFRLSTNGDLGVGGAADDGEVEDYFVTIAAPASSPRSFVGEIRVNPAEGAPRDVAVGDINGDGLLDMLGGFQGTVGEEGPLTWFEQTAPATFTEHVIDTAATTRDVKLADVDGDGDLDAIAALLSDNAIVWYEQANGQFTLQTVADNLPVAAAVEVADLDGDGDVDLVGSIAGTSELLWFENDGSQNFTQHLISSNAVFAADIEVVDLDRDGNLDVLFTTRGDNTVRWMQHDGAGNFVEQIVVSGLGGPFALASADINGDGHMDLLTASQVSNEIAWHENDGSEVFTKRVIDGNSQAASDVNIADIDGDGDLDVLGMAAADGKVAWYANDGVGGFTENVIVTGALNSETVIAGDVDGDGTLDVLSLDSDNDFVWYVDNGFDFGDAPAPFPTTVAANGAKHRDTGPLLGSQRDAERDGQADDGADEDGIEFGVIQVGASGATVQVTVNGDGAKLDGWIDFNGDGNWDDVGEQIFDNVAVEFGTQTLTFDVPTTAVSGETFSRFRLSTEGDLAVTGSTEDGEVEDYLLTIVPPSASLGAFGDATLLTDSNGESQAVADFNGDGNLDIVTMVNLGPAFIEGSLAVFLGDGAGNFSEVAITDPAQPIAFVADFLAADFDGDGDQDFATLTGTRDQFTWYENLGGTQFAPHLISDTLFTFGTIAASDLDSDGDVDLFLSESLDDQITWFVNDGSGDFTTQAISATTPVLADFGDIDGDGDLDILYQTFFTDDPNQVTGELKWQRNDGQGNFTEETINDTILRSAILVDVDADGDLDVIGNEDASFSAVLLRNDGNGTFGPQEELLGSDDDVRIAAADIDGDGDFDFIFGDGPTFGLRWAINDGTGAFTRGDRITSMGLPSDLDLGDVDNDGDLDAIGGVGRLFWTENVINDFGDAPAPFPTTLADDGARHRVSGPRLGSAIDEEFDAQADDGADEDGVVFGSVQVGQFGASVEVTVTGEAGKLDAWIDFNGDNNWGGPEEQIFRSVTVTPGVNTLFFDVPASAVDGQVFSRFRLSTEGGLGIGGFATDGEVEDHAVSIARPRSSNGLFLEQFQITNLAEDVEDIAVADVNGDGRVDVVAANPSLNQVAWYEQLPSGDFVQRDIDNGIAEAIDVHVADIDGDGDLDVFSTSLTSGQIFLHINDGDENFSTRVVAENFTDSRGLDVADVDGDGILDFTAASTLDNSISWFRQDAAGDFTRNIITTNVDFVTEVELGDLDGDGDLDVASVSISDDKVAWFENAGDGTFTEQVIPFGFGEPTDLRMADLNGDGDLDLVIADRNSSRFVWLENDGSGEFAFRGITSIGESVDANGVTVADFNGDGILDVAGTLRSGDIQIFLHNGRGIFTEQRLEGVGETPFKIDAADFDGDGDLDFAVSFVSPNRISWFENIATDFGDAPAPFPTLRADDGAFHDVNGPRLGDRRDFEDDGQADDGLDEDGVLFGEIQTGSSIAALNIDLQNADSAFVDAWIDFNNDGVWSESEQILSSRAVVAGLQTLNYSIDTLVVATELAARVRVSETGGLEPTGFGGTGEVEDYIVSVTPFSDALIVSTTADEVDSDLSFGSFSLREAVLIANALPGHDTISFTGGLAGSTITLTGGVLELTDSMTINGLGADRLTISGGGQTRIFQEVADRESIIDVSINDLALTDGFSNNGARPSVFESDDANVEFNRVLIADNVSDVIVSVGSGELTMDQSAIVNNQVFSSFRNRSFSSYDGNGALNLNRVEATITNTTISGNEHNGLVVGFGGLSSVRNLRLSGVTIADNYGSGVHLGLSTGDVHFAYDNSIIANNRQGLIEEADNLDEDNLLELFGPTDDISGSIFPGLSDVTVESLGFNILRRTPTGVVEHDPAFGDQRGVDPLLGELTDNLGPTPLHSLLAGSPAIDAGNSSLTADQRGALRPFDDPSVSNASGGNGSDIGAFEIAPVEAASFVVTTEIDVVNALDQVTSLREAVELANSTAGVDEITFDESLAGATLTLGGTELVIEDSTIIDASNLTERVTISGGGLSRVIHVSNSLNNVFDLTLNGVNVRDGVGRDNLGGGGILFNPAGKLELNSSSVDGNAARFAGGINSFGLLVLNQSSVNGNSAQEEVGGILAPVVEINESTLSNNSATAGAGGLLVANTATIVDSTLSGNTTDGPGGAIVATGSTITITGSTLSGNTAGGLGGAIFATGSTVTITGSTLSDNSSDADGGAISGVDVELAISDSNITNNSAGEDGGGIHNTGTLTITGSTLSGNTAGGVGGAVLATGGTVAITGSTLSDNSSAADGGAISGVDVELEISDSNITNNSAGEDGGGIHNSGTLTLTGSTLSGNTAGNDGGAIATAGDDRVVQSTFADNTASRNGGAIAVASGDLRVTSSTISGNEAGGLGGGVFSALGVPSANDGIIRLTDVTLVENASQSGGGVFLEDPAGSLIGSNTILAKNTADGQPSDIAAPVESLVAFNTSLIGVGDGLSIDGDANLVGTAAQPLDPLIAPLADNGGPTQTHALRGGSPALDAGLSLQPTDQRGLNRIVDNPFIDDAFDGTDIGAFESPPPETPSFVVTTSLDVVEVLDQVTSLREAVLLANSTPELDTITFAPELAGSTITLVDGVLRLSEATTIIGLGAQNLTISGDEQFRVFDEAGNNQKVITITDLTIADGFAFQGAAFAASRAHAIFERVVMTNNSGNRNSSTLEMREGTLEITDSAIIDNGFGRAGTLRLEDSQTTIINTTFSGNGVRPINVFNRNSSEDRLSLSNVTIADNGANPIEIVADGGPTLFEYQNTILDAGGRSAFRVRGNNLAGLTMVSVGHNLLNGSLSAEAAHDAGPGDLRDTDPLLGELADNGGPTPTHALLPGSPAINAGNNNLAVDSDGNPLQFDQRGEDFDRIFEGNVDIGAFESQVDIAIPTVESFEINDGDVQRSMVKEITVAFSEIVNVTAEDFILQNTDTGANITPLVSTEVISGKTIATLTFDGDGIIGRSLADGNYRLTVLDTITDRVGNALDGDGDGEAGGNASDEFFRLYGDVNGDRTVNIIDFFQFRGAFGNDDLDERFDFNGDGVVNILDFFQFRSRFGTSI